jgi:hypothetical protein
MILRSCLIIIFGALWFSPTFAQSSVGGPSKQKNFVGGPTKQTNPVVPSGRGEVANPTQSLPKKTKK